MGSLWGAGLLQVLKLLGAASGFLVVSWARLDRRVEGATAGTRAAEQRSRYSRRHMWRGLLQALKLLGSAPGTLVVTRLGWDRLHSRCSRRHVTDGRSSISMESPGEWSVFNRPGVAGAVL